MDHTPLQRAIEAKGSQAALADAIGVSQQAVSYWLKSAEGRPSAEYAVKIERETGIPRHELRPDLFDPPLDAA